MHQQPRSPLAALAASVLVVLFGVSSFAVAQPRPAAPPAITPASTAPTSTAPTSTAPLAPGEERVKITVIEVVRLVRVRQAEDQPYQIAKVGMVLDEGAEFQTGPGARVRVAVPPDQTVTIDRLTTCKVLRARVADGGNVAKTDLGMKYGRTQYDVEAAGVEHESSIRSPGSTLAVRGTKNMVLYDHGPFAPIASASQPVAFRNLRRQVVRFGQTGRTAVVRGTDNSPAETQVEATRTSPTPANAQSPTENAVRTFIGNYPGLEFQDTGVIAAVRRDRFGQFAGALAAALPTERAVQFQLRWFNVPFADVNFSVVATNGNTISINNQTVDAGRGTLGFFRGGDGQGGNGVASKTGFGAEIIELPSGFPTGNYVLRAELASPVKGGAKGRVLIDLQFNVIQTDPSLPKREPVILTLGGSRIDPQKPATATRTVFVDTDVVREVKGTATTRLAKAKQQRPATKPERPQARPARTARR